MRDFSRASSELQVIARNCDWFIALPASVVIGQSDYFGLVFRQSLENRSIEQNLKPIRSTMDLLSLYVLFSMPNQ